MSKVIRGTGLTAVMAVLAIVAFADARVWAASAGVGSVPSAPKKAILPAPVRTLRPPKRHDAKQEIARYSKLLAKKSNDEAALLGRGKAYVSRREYVSAFADYDRAAQLAPQSKTARYGRAAVRVLLQDQAARRTAAANPARNNAAPVLDGSQFDDDGTIRSHVELTAPTVARN